MVSIQGLQKLTLLDYPGKMACTLFTGGCNFRCPFCHNGDLVLSPNNQVSLSEEELFAFLRKRHGILDGVCISGGEPLLYPEISELIQKIKALGYEIKLDTNGSFPNRLKELVRAGLIDYVAMDIKNAPGQYAKTVGLREFDPAPIYESVDFLLSGSIPYEFRTTVIKEFHSAKDFREIGVWIVGARAYYLQDFVDSEAVIQADLHAYGREELLKFRDVLRPYVPNTYIRGDIEHED